ncbi:hypothetical protein Tco_0133939 [Tanacetum coccineum]
MNFRSIQVDHWWYRSLLTEKLCLRRLDQGSVHMVTTFKSAYASKPVGEYELWRMRDGNVNSFKDAKFIVAAIGDESVEIHGVCEKYLKEDVETEATYEVSVTEWNTHTIVWRKKPKIDTLSLAYKWSSLILSWCYNASIKLPVVKQPLKTVLNTYTHLPLQLPIVPNT